MTKILVGTLRVPQGTTIIFATNFFDQFGNITQPNAGFMNIAYSINGVAQQSEIQMTPPTGQQSMWTALWDTRGVDASVVNWSCHSSGPPCSVEIGNFILTANSATLNTF